MRIFEKIRSWNRRRRRFHWLRAAHLRLGCRGEHLAATALQELGLDILCRNYRGSQGELDIVARDGTTLCFVEVKTRHRSLRSRPAEAVTEAKRRHLLRTAAQYRRQIGDPPLVYRHDIVEVVFENGKLLELRYLRNAFGEGERGIRN